MNPRHRGAGVPARRAPLGTWTAQPHSRRMLVARRSAVAGARTLARPPRNPYDTAGALFSGLWFYFVPWVSLQGALKVRQVAVRAVF